MELNLSRKLPVRVYEGWLVIARPHKRPDLHAVLLRAQERRGGTTAEDVATHLLKGRPSAVGLRLLVRCARLGLLTREQDRNVDEEVNPFAWGRIDHPAPATTQSAPTVSDKFRLTDTGRSALNEKEVFEQEEGRFRLWLTGDALVPLSLLDIQPVPEPELRRGQNGQDVGKLETPPLVRTLLGNVIELPGQKSLRVRIDRTPESVVSVSLDEDTRLTWRVPESGRSRLNLSGRFHAEFPGPSVQFQRLWQELLGPRKRDWESSVQGGRLLVVFGEANEEGRKTFRMTWRLDVPQTGEFGDFEPSEVAGVPIGPRSDRDAQNWAEWLLEESIETHLGSAEYDPLRERIRGRFPGSSVRLPTREELAAKLRSRAQKGEGKDEAPRLEPAYWYLRATIDVPEVG